MFLLLALRRVFPPLNLSLNRSWKLKNAVLQRSEIEFGATHWACQLGICVRYVSQS